MKLYENTLTLSDKIALLNINDSTFHGKILNLKGKERRIFIENSFDKLENKDLIIQIYNEECMEEDYNLNLNDILK